MMDYAAFVADTWRDNTLHSVLLELTYRCDLRCFFCYNDRIRRGRSLSLDQYRRLLDDLAEMNVLHLVLSGGEPLAHAEFWEIAQHAREEGFAIRLKSSGHSIGRRVAQRLKRDVAPFLIEVSLHGACAATHERQTRVKGSFGRLMRNVQAMLDAGIRVQLNAVLTRWNESEIEEMCALADRLRTRLQIDPSVTPRDDGQPAPLSISATEEGLKRLRDVQRVRLASVAPPPAASDQAASDVTGARDVSLQECRGKYCGAGSNGLAVDPYGWVYPCVQWRVPVGSLHSQSVTEIWRHSAELRRVRALNVEIGRKLRDRLGPEQGFWVCPARSPRVVERGRLTVEPI
jgi:MoaA/NifB/PqqE/SkfB family radical SAM enzyme